MWLVKGLIGAAFLAAAITLVDALLGNPALKPLLDRLEVKALLFFIAVVSVLIFAINLYFNLVAPSRRKFVLGMLGIFAALSGSIVMMVYAALPIKSVNAHVAGGADVSKRAAGGSIDFDLQTPQADPAIAKNATGAILAIGLVILCFGPMYFWACSRDEDREARKAEAAKATPPTWEEQFRN